MTCAWCILLDMIVLEIWSAVSIHTACSTYKLSPLSKSYNRKQSIYLIWLHWFTFLDNRVIEEKIFILSIVQLRLHVSFNVQVLKYTREVVLKLLSFIHSAWNSIRIHKRCKMFVVYTFVFSLSLVDGTKHIILVLCLFMFILSCYLSIYVYP